MLCVNGLCFAYKDFGPLLNDVTLSLHKGTITALMGPSGCGKSTLLRILMGVEKGADNKKGNKNGAGKNGANGKGIQGTLTLTDAPGQIPSQSSLQPSLQNFELSGWNESQTLFGIVPQTPHLLPWKTILENVTLAARVAVAARATAPGTATQSQKMQSELLAREALARVGLETHAAKYPWQMSLGMASRAAFARALVMGLPGLLLDEPFAALDAHTRSLMQQWLVQQTAKFGTHTLLVTHDAREALLVARDIVVLGGSQPASVVLRVQVPEQARPQSSDKGRSETQAAWRSSPEFRALEMQLEKAMGTTQISG